MLPLRLNALQRAPFVRGAVPGLVRRLGADPVPSSPDASVNFYLLFLTRLGLRHSTQKTSCIVSQRKAAEYSRLFKKKTKKNVVHALFVDYISGFVETDRVLSLQ